MAHVWIVGSGVVGQATGRGFLKRGHAVTFIDIDHEKVQRIRAERLRAFVPRDVKGRAEEADVMVLTVPTPTVEGTIDLTFLKVAAKNVGTWMVQARRYQVVVVRSTVVPGTTEDVVRPILERVSGKRAGKDFGLCMNPEYLREKAAVTDFDEPRLVTIGQLDERSGDTLAAVYEGFACSVVRLTIREAELQKYAHNLFNAVKISFFNEFREICRRAGADAEAIFPLVAQSAEAMWNPEYGIHDFGPFDGMCLPKDTEAFLSWARAQGWTMPILAAAVEFNQRLTARLLAELPEVVAEKKVEIVPEVAQAR